MRSIFLKIFTGFLFIIISFSGIVIIKTNDYVEKYFLNSQILDIHKLNSSIIYSIQNDLINNKSDELNKKLNDFAKLNSVRITLILPDGKVIFDSEKDVLLMENHLYRPEIISARQLGIGDTIRFSHTVQEGLLYSACAIKNNSDIIAYSRLSISLTKIQALINEITSKIIFITFLSMFFSIIAIYLFSRSLIKPIKKIVDVSQKIADGNFNAKIYLNNKDELATLANSINLMSIKLNSLFKENFQQTEKLETIFSSIKDGILVIDSKNHISYSNNNFHNTINQKDIINKHFWEIITDTEFSKLIKKIKNSKSYNSKEIQINKKFYLASGSWIESNHEVVIILNDIDEIKKIEIIKKDFISNVSHELKTPLTAIKGFVETMEDDIDDNNKNYLAIIKRQTERLISIVQDLLLLSKLEAINFKIELTEVEIDNLTTNILKLFELKIKEKKLTFKYSNNSGQNIIHADYFMLEQVFINLFDNAIKFSEKGEFGLNITKENSDMILEFWDSGIGIPENHLNRIFERFFTVDKSRSKNLSGTGLGLAIVKHIVMIHNGTVFCKSTIGIGTKFIVKIPE